MLPTTNGSIRLLQVSGIQVFLHWSWLVVAVIQIESRRESYSSPVWNVAEYLALFFIVLLHEFGHVLACRQVKGQADRIVLWPLGGVAYVAPPQRPGAVLWSIAAGPLVNVILAPVLYFAGFGSGFGSSAGDDTYSFFQALFIINAVLLVFNLLPIYPLDGGQILRALLWFVVGPARSLLIASGIGFVGVAALLPLAVWWESIWIGITAIFVFMSCRQGWLRARALLRLAAAPRRSSFACSSCHAAPPAGAFWGCAKCGRAFDTFEHGAICPNCQAHYAEAQCLSCGEWNTPEAWASAAHTTSVQDGTPPLAAAAVSSSSAPR
jgi:Zn-dependent protease